MRATSQGPRCIELQCPLPPRFAAGAKGLPTVLRYCIDPLLPPTLEEAPAEASRSSPSNPAGSMFAHLTNSSVNVYSDAYERNTGCSAAEMARGSKRSLTSTLARIARLDRERSLVRPAGCQRLWRTRTSWRTKPPSSPGRSGVAPGAALSAGYFSPSCERSSRSHTTSASSGRP